MCTVDVGSKVRVKINGYLKYFRKQMFFCSTVYKHYRAQFIYQGPDLQKKS